MLKSKHILALFAAVACAALCLAKLPAGESPQVECRPLKIRPQDEIWLVSTRDLDCVDCRLTAAPQLCVWQFDQKSRTWSSATVENFLSTDNPETPTNVFIHGNWISFSDSVNVSFTYYLHQAAYAPSPRPLRLVIWSWPSTRGKRPLRDVRAKYGRTPTEAEYLAWLLGRISPRVKVSLVGYSYGAAIAVGALHRLEQHGGTLASQPASRVEREPNRAVLFAAADSNFIMAPGEAHELAVSRVDSLLNLTNACDPALRRFRFVETCNRSEALGYHGATGLSAAQWARVRELDCTAIVGKQHYWLPYVTSPSLILEMRPYIWFDDSL